MDKTRFQFPSYTLPTGGFGLDAKYRLFPYYGLDSPVSTLYDSIPVVHNAMCDLWVGSMDQAVVWNAGELRTTGDH